MSQRRRWACGLYAGVFVAVGAILVGAAPAAASGPRQSDSVNRLATTTPPTYSFSSGLANVTTSSGVKMLLAVYAMGQSVDGSSNATEVEVNLYQPTSNSTFLSNGKSEDYDFQNVPNSAFKVTGSGKNASKVVISMNGSDWGSTFGSLKLTATPAKYTNAACENAAEGGYQRNYTVSVKGSLNFDTSENGTQPSKLGKISVSKPVFTAHKSTSTLSVEGGCQPKYPTPKSYCTSSADVTSPTVQVKSGKLQATESIGADSYSSNGTSSTDVYAIRNVSIPLSGAKASSERGSGGVPSTTATRVDEVYEFASKFRVSSKVPTTKPYPISINLGPSSNDKLLKGSAIASIPKSARSTASCILNSKAGAPTDTQISYSNYIVSSTNYTQVPVKWTNGSTPLTATPNIGGPITLKNQSGKNSAQGMSGYAYLETYK